MPDPAPVPNFRVQVRLPTAADLDVILKARDSAALGRQLSAFISAPVEVPGERQFQVEAESFDIDATLQTLKEHDRLLRDETNRKRGLPTDFQVIGLSAPKELLNGVSARLKSEAATELQFTGKLEEDILRGTISETQVRFLREVTRDPTILSASVSASPEGDQPSRSVLSQSNRLADKLSARFPPMPTAKALMTEIGIPLQSLETLKGGECGDLPRAEKIKIVATLCDELFSFLGRPQLISGVLATLMARAATLEELFGLELERECAQISIQTLERCSLVQCLEVAVRGMQVDSDYQGGKIRVSPLIVSGGDRGLRLLDPTNPKEATILSEILAAYIEEFGHAMQKLAEDLDPADEKDTDVLSRSFPEFAGPSREMDNRAAREVDVVAWMVERAVALGVDLALLARIIYEPSYPARAKFVAWVKSTGRFELPPSPDEEEF